VIFSHLFQENVHSCVNPGYFYPFWLGSLLTYTKICISAGTDHILDGGSIAIDCRLISER